MIKRKPITYEDLKQVFIAMQEDYEIHNRINQIKKKRVNFVVGLLTLLHLR